MVPPPITSLPPPPASLPAPPTSLPGATISSGPQPSAMPSGYPGQTPVSLPPLHYQGLNAPQPFGYQPPPPGMGMPMMHPARMAALGGPPGPSVPVAGVVRSADEMTGADDDPVTLAKRQRVEKLPGGHLYPEQNWIDMHPVRFSDVAYVPILTCSVTSIPFICKCNSPPIQPNRNGNWMAKSLTLAICTLPLLSRHYVTASLNNWTARFLLGGCDWYMRAKNCETRVT